MTSSYWPFDGVDTNETQYSQLFRRMQATGVWGDDEDNSLKLLSAGGLGLTLKSGYAMVRGHMYYNDADITINETAGGATARKDLLVLRLDPTANTILPVILPGAGGSGVAPAPTQTDAGVYEMPLSTIDVAASASSVSAGNITDVRPFMGHIFGMWTTANRPVAPRKGQPGFNLTTGLPEWYRKSDASWVPFAPTTFAISQITDIANASVANAAKVGGKTIFVQSATPAANAVNDLWFW